MKTMTIDTETGGPKTGFPTYSDPSPAGRGRSDHPDQPHMLAVAARLVEDGNVLRKIVRYQKPDGWKIDERLIGDNGKPTAFSVNKLGNDFLMEKGVPLAELMDELDAEYFAHADEIVAFNATFDRKILRIAYMRRYGRDGQPRKGVAPTPWFCPMKTLQPIMKMPPTQGMINNPRAGAFKPPKLMEAYQWAFGKTFEGAHGADADEQALYELWLHMREKMPEVPLHRLFDRDS